jgi:hypothetical protein
MFHLFDTYSAGISLLCSALFEAIAVSWFYGKLYSVLTCLNCVFFFSSITSVDFPQSFHISAGKKATTTNFLILCDLTLIGF